MRQIVGIVLWLFLSPVLFSQTRVEMVPTCNGETIPAIITRIAPVVEFPYYAAKIDPVDVLMDRPDTIRMEIANDFFRRKCVFKRWFVIPKSEYRLLLFRQDFVVEGRAYFHEHLVMVDMNGVVVDFKVSIGRYTKTDSTCSAGSQWAILDRGKVLYSPRYSGFTQGRQEKTRTDFISRLSREGRYVLRKVIEYEPQVYDDSKLSDRQYNIWDGQEKVIRSERVKLYKEKRRSTK